MKIRGSYILFFNQSLAIHHLKYSYNYQNIFQVLHTTNVEHYVSTTKFITIMPAVPLPVSLGREKYACEAHTQRVRAHHKKPHSRRNQKLYANSFKWWKCLDCCTAIGTNKCNIIRVTNHFLFLCSFSVYAVNPGYLRTASQRCNNS